MKKIYLDHAATTPVASEVLEAMKPYFSEKFGNASSLHSFGIEAREVVEKSRRQVAKFLNVRTDEIIFTSGGTESNNLALKGIAFANKNKGNHIITCQIEHPAIRKPCEWLKKHGFKVSYLDVDKNGLVNPVDVEKAITKDTILVSIMTANNEIGTIEPIQEIGKICKKKKIYFHTDAVQALGKIPIDVKKMNIDLLSGSSHKLYGPKGVGILYIKHDIKIEPINHGGGHEQGLRSGTENTAGIVGFARAIKLAEKIMKKEAERQTNLRDKIIKTILQIDGAKLNGHPTKRLPNNINVSIKGVEGEALLIRLNEKEIAVSTGSACSTKSLKSSHVLTSIGLTDEQAHGSLRITLGKDNTNEDIDYVIEELKKIINSLRKINPLKW
jgi:cysteine desulfurase